MITIPAKKILVAIFAISWQTLPCWNYSSTICRLARDSAYCFTWSWEMVSCRTVSSLCLVTRFNCSCKDSTCRLAWWLNENKIHYLNNRNYHKENQIPAKNSLPQIFQLNLQKQWHFCPNSSSKTNKQTKST